MRAGVSAMVYIGIKREGQGQVLPDQLFIRSMAGIFVLTEYARDVKILCKDAVPNPCYLQLDAAQLLHAPSVLLYSARYQDSASPGQTLHVDCLPVTSVTARTCS